jgi:pyrophosphatase PpaX
LLDHGVEVDLAFAIEHCFGRPSVDIASQFKISNPEAFRERVWQRVLDRMHLVEQYPAVQSTITKLRAHAKSLAVVTNSRRGHVAPVLDRWQLAHAFDTVVSIEDVSKGKPNPEPLLTALERLKAEPESAWMIGDSLADIHAAHAAGVRSIAFSPADNHPYSERQLLEAANPTHIVESYHEILSILAPS